MLTIKKLEAFLELLEVNFQDYLIQLIPATTILLCQGTTYRNTIFHRQKFVYKEGINQGSEFQNALPPDLRPNLTPIQLSPAVNDFFDLNVNPIIINSDVSQGIGVGLTAVQIQGFVNVNNFTAGVEAFDISGEIETPTSSTTTIPLP